MTYFHRAIFRRFSVSSPHPAAPAVRAPRGAAEVEAQSPVQDEPAADGEPKTEKLDD